MNIHPILDRIYADRVIYCVQPWCARASKLTRAQLFIGLNGQPRMPACCDCAAALQSAEPQPIELWYIDDDLRAQWWAAIDGAIGGGTPPQTEPPAPAAVPDPEPAGRKRIPWGAWIAGACALASLILGIVMVSIASAEWSNYVNGSQSGSPPDVGALKGWGIFFIVAPLVPVGLALILLILIGPIALANEHINKQMRKAWEAGQRQGMPVNDLITAGALTGAALLWHHRIREHQAHVAASAMGQAPLNDVHAGMKHTQGILQQQAAQRQAQWDARQQFQPDPIQAPFSGTPVSDIYGNVRYRKRPWP
jgi:hypothetical protein